MNKQAQLKALAKRMSPMHLKMAVAISEGQSSKGAYITAGGKGKNPIQSASQMVLTNIDISIYAELSKETIVEVAQERGLATFEEKADLLWTIAQHNAGVAQNDTDKGEDEEIKMVDAKASISAIAAHNAMTGDLAAIKTDNKTAIDLSGYSDAQLEVMADG